MNTTSCRLDFGQMCNVLISNSTRGSVGGDFIDPANKWRVVVDSDTPIAESERTILGFSKLKEGQQGFFLNCVRNSAKEAIAQGKKTSEMKFLSTPFRITKVEITGDLELLSLIGLVDTSVYGVGVFLPERFGTTYRPLEMRSTPAKYFR